MFTHTLKHPYAIASVGFFKAYWVTMRPYLLFVSGITGLTGLAFSPTVDMVTTSLVFAASFLSYGFGQALTDCFQTDTDSISSPYRPLTQGVISKGRVLLVSMLGLVICSFVFAYFNLLALLLGVLAVAGLATYTPFKRRWWGGPWYNAWIVVVLCLMAYLAGTGAQRSTSNTVAFACMLVTVFFGYANFVLVGYFKDISADRATGYNTVPVVFGRRFSVWVSYGLTILTLASAIASVVASRDTVNIQPYPLWILAAGIVTSMIGQVCLHNVGTDEEAHRPIGWVVHSYILLLSAIVAVRRPSWTLFLVMFYVAFVLVLSLRPVRSQI